MQFVSYIFRQEKVVLAPSKQFVGTVNAHCQHRGFNGLVLAANHFKVRSGTRICNAIFHLRDIID